MHERRVGPADSVQVLDRDPARHVEPSERKPFHRGVPEFSPVGVQDHLHGAGAQVVVVRPTGHVQPALMIEYKPYARALGLGADFLVELFVHLAWATQGSLKTNFRR